MKNKRNTYLLLASVVVIWGIIIYKILHVVRPDKSPAETGAFFAGFTPKPLQEQDTFSISEHRRDPFLGTFTAPESPPVRPQRQKPVPAPEAPQIAVSFSGMITGPTAATHIFFVSVNNRQYIMSPGDEVEGVTLVKGDAKAIRIRYNGQLKIISLTP